MPLNALQITSRSTKEQLSSAHVSGAASLVGQQGALLPRDASINSPLLPLLTDGEKLEGSW